MLELVVVAVLAVLIFIGLKNKKKIVAEQQKAAEEKKIAEEKAAEEKKIAEQKAAAEIKERFNAEFEKMWANLENDPYSYGDEFKKLRERLGIDAKTDIPVFDNCFKNEVKAKIYSRSSSAMFIIGSRCKEWFASKMERAYNDRKLMSHLVGFVMCANRYEKFTGNYADYPKLSDEEISNFIVHETTFSDNSASSIANVRDAIGSFIFYLSYEEGLLNGIFPRVGEGKGYDEFVFDFVCSATFSAYFNDCEYEKGNSKSMIDCIYNNVPVTTRYWFCKNIEYIRIDLTHMMYNHDAAFSAMLNHYGLTRADQVADSNVPRQGTGLAGEFDGRNC